MSTIFKPLLILVLVVAAAHLWFNTVDYAGIHSDIDLKHYRHMAAAAPAIQHSEEAPFCYRILPPWLAGVAAKGLGDELMGFRLVSALAVLFASMMLYLYLVHKRVERATALLMSCLAIISQHVLGGVIFNPFQTCDALAIGLMLTALLCIERGSVVGFVLATVAGAATREPCMLMLPVAIVFYASKFFYASKLFYASKHSGATDLGVERDRRGEDMKQVFVWTLSCVPAVVVALGLRSMIQPVNADWSLGLMVTENAYKFLKIETWLRLVVFAAAPTSFLPLLFFRETRTLLAANKHLAVLLVLVVASTFLGADTERLVAPAMVVYYLIAAHVLDKKPAITMQWFLVLAALLCSMHPIYVRFSPFAVTSQIEGGLLNSLLGVAGFYLLSVVCCLGVARTAYRTVHR